jgi:hypothetical protein
MVVAMCVCVVQAGAVSPTLEKGDIVCPQLIIVGDQVGSKYIVYFALSLILRADCYASPRYVATEKGRCILPKSCR